MWLHLCRRMKKGSWKSKFITSPRLLFSVPSSRTSKMGQWQSLHRLGTGVGLIRRKVSLKKATYSPHGTHPLFYSYHSSNGLFSLLACKLLQASIMSMLLSRNKIRTNEWQLMGIRFLISVKEEAPRLHLWSSGPCFHCRGQGSVPIWENSICCGVRPK